MLKFLSNENISPLTTEFVKNLGFDIVGVRDVGLKGSPDEKVVEYAIQHNRVIITQDLDYGEMYYFSTAKNLGIIILRLRSQWHENINKELEAFLSIKKNELAIFKDTLIILQEGKFRIHRK